MSANDEGEVGLVARRHKTSEISLEMHGTSVREPRPAERKVKNIKMIARNP